MPPRNLYEILMLHPSADIGIITTVYRQLAKRYHPDHDPSLDAHARMAELNEAYATLSDPWRRSRYDLSLSTGGRPTGPPEPRAQPRSPDGAWAVAVPVASAADASCHGEAGPPPSYPRPSGTVFSFGRYRGWSISQVAYHDRTYLEWLERTPSGRAYRQELTAVLTR